MFLPKLRRCFCSRGCAGGLVEGSDYIPVISKPHRSRAVVNIDCTYQKKNTWKSNFLQYCTLTVTFCTATRGPQGMNCITPHNPVIMSHEVDIWMKNEWHSHEPRLFLGFHADKHHTCSSSACLHSHCMHVRMLILAISVHGSTTFAALLKCNVKLCSHV